MFRILLPVLFLTACSAPISVPLPPVVTDLPVPVTTTPPAPEPQPPVLQPPAPSPTPEPVPAPPPLLVLDESAVTTTLEDSRLTVQLAPEVSGVWLRLTLPDGSESGVTDHGACRCVGLGGDGPHRIVVLNLPGMTVLTSPTLDGSWTVAARTQ